MIRKIWELLGVKNNRTNLSVSAADTNRQQSCFITKYKNQNKLSLLWESYKNIFPGNYNYYK